MEMTAQGKVTGFTFWDQPVDGKEIDSGSVFIESQLKGVNAKGCASQLYKCMSAKVIKKVHHIPTPFVAVCVFEMQTNGKGDSSQVCIDIRPVAADVGGKDLSKKAA